MKMTFKTSKLSVLLGLAAAAVAAPAAAQSSVTVYGLLDVFVQHGKGNATTTKLESGGLNGSRLGFKGTEDLGDGLKALFQIESGINVDAGTTGQGGTMWGRQAYVGLSSAGVGTVTLGRQYVPHYLGADANDPFSTGAGSGWSSSVLTTVFRANNAVQYETPNLGGFTATLMQTAGEGTVGAKLSTAHLRYAQGPLGLSLALLQSNTVEKQKFATLAGSYDFGVAKLLAGVQDIKNSTGALNAKDDRKEFWAGVQIPAGQGSVRLAYYDGKFKDVAGKHATQWSAGYTYDLSKRTSLYGVYTAIDNDTGTAYTTYAATGGGVTVSSGVDAKALQVGLRHRF